MSLRKIAETFNTQKKLPFPYKFSNIENLSYAGTVPPVFYFNSKDDYAECCSINEFFDFKKYTIFYCSRDVLITKSFVRSLVKMLNNFKISFNNVYSAPSLSMKIFVNNFNKNKLSLRYNFMFDKIIRNAYFGGRTEVYGNPIKGEFIFHYDFSGMYAQCMKQKFCFGKYCMTKRVNVEKAGYYIIEYESDMKFPILPHHRLSNNKLMFTNGRNVGCF